MSKKKSTNIHVIDKAVSIVTPSVQVHIETKDSRDTIKMLKDMAEKIIDKYKRG